MMTIKMNYLEKVAKTAALLVTLVCVDIQRKNVINYL